MRVCQGVLISLLGLGSLRMLYTWQVSTANAAGTDISVETPTDSKSRYRLCQVHILCRHGARTPINVIPGIEEVTYNRSEMLRILEHADIPYVLKEEHGKKLEHPGEVELSYQKRKLKGDSEVGQLTHVGQQQAYDFGVSLRKKYIDGPEKFLNHKFTREEVYLRSTNIKRTIETLRSVIAGLYGKSHVGEPLVIRTVNDHEEVLYPNPHCSIIQLMFNRDWMHFEPPTSDMYKDQKMFEDLLKIDKNAKQQFDFVHVRDDLACRMIHGLEMPEMLTPYYERIDKHAVRMFLQQCAGFNVNDHRVMVRLGSGPVLRRFRDKMEDHIRGVKSPKMFIYSAHDSSIVPLLVALGSFDHKWPPFLANVTVELYSSSDDHVKDTKYGRPTYFVKVSYCDKPITIPGCSAEMCPYDTFWKSLSDYEVPSDAMPVDCFDQVKHREIAEEYKKIQNAGLIKQPEPGSAPKGAGL